MFVVDFADILNKVGLIDSFQLFQHHHRRRFQTETVAYDNVRRKKLLFDNGSYCGNYRCAACRISLIALYDQSRTHTVLD